MTIRSITPVLLVLLITCGLQVGPVRAKDIDYTPDVTSDAYWDTHHIGVVRVTNSGRGGGGQVLITYRLVTQISEGPMEQTRTVRLLDLWFGMYVEEPPPLAVDNFLVIYYAKAGPSPIVTTKLDTSPDESPLVRRLRRIASLRANQGGLQALTESVFGDDAVVAVYSLKRLLSLPPFAVQDDYVARLIKLRDEEGREPQVRLLANQLANKLEGKPSYSDDEYAWITRSIAQSRQQDWKQVSPFVDRLVEFQGKRGATVAFLVQLVRDQERPLAIRIAAYSPFDDPRLFHFRGPDAESNRIFDACIEMLKDREPVIRSAGAVLLHNLSADIDPAMKQIYAARAKTAITNAIAVEKNDQVRYQLKIYLGLISGKSPREILGVAPRD